MNKVEMNPERYIVANMLTVKDCQELMVALSKTIPNPQTYFGEDFCKEALNDDTNKVLAKKLLESDSSELRWLGFRMSNVGEKCVLDTETGEMFTID